MEARSKINDLTGYKLISPTNTLCLAPEYHAWLYTKEQENSTVYAERLHGDYVPRAGHHEKNVHEVDRVTQARRTTVTTTTNMALVSEVSPPEKSVSGISKSLKAANDSPKKTNLRVVVGPVIPDELSEMRKSRVRKDSNIDVIKKGGMSRPRARIVALEEDKRVIAIIDNVPEVEAPVLYLPPEKVAIDYELPVKDWVDKFTQDKQEG